jgi:type II secretory pathway component GspD/PulD (secretin)
VSSPRVITADQQKALIEQGEELPYQVATSSGATSLQFRKANLKLEVTPQVTPEGNVILDVDITKDSVGRATTAGFAINTKHVKTQGAGRERRHRRDRRASSSRTTARTSPRSLARRRSLPGQSVQDRAP